MWLVRLKSIRSIGQTEESEGSRKSWSVEGSGEIDKTEPAKNQERRQEP